MATRISAFALIAQGNASDTAVLPITGADNTTYKINMAMVRVATSTPTTDNTGQLGDGTHRWATAAIAAITGNLTGNVTGNASGSSGSCTGNAATATTASACSGNAATATSSASCSGNAATATKLATARNINGQLFDGSADITITAVAAAGSLTGSTLAAGVTGSSLTSVGTLTSLAVSGTASAGTFTGPLTGNVTGNCSGSSGSCTGNAATATLCSTATTATTAGTVTTAAQPAITSLGTLASLNVTTGATPSVPTFTYDGNSAHHGMEFNDVGAGAFSGVIQNFVRNGSLVGQISSGTNSVAFSSLSDARMKIDHGVAKRSGVLRGLIIHDFEWKSDGSRDRGVFAQEAILVKPTAVVEGDNARMWTVDNAKFVPELIVGWQEHETRLSALETALDTLLAGSGT